MAIPLLVYAAVPIVARYIAKKGMAAAMKKFTKKAINAAAKEVSKVKESGRVLGKRADRLMNPTQKQKNIESLTMKQRAADKRAVQGFATGLGTGVAGTTAVTFATKDPTPKRKPKTSSMTTKGKSEKPPKSRNTVKDKPKASASKQVNPKDFPTYKKDTKSAMSFRAATTEAKKAGKKTFTWEGRKYSTKEK
tara:strand:- start:267 stop:845 length:579 start_codon:yes stop_codon:yes gene_type:complete